MRLDRQQLPLVVPFVERGRLIQPLVALQADQLGGMGRGQRFCHFRLADARFAFEQQWPLEQLHQRNRGRKLAVGDVAGSSQRLRDLVAMFHGFSVVIARSVATKQSILSFLGGMDCFAALAMTKIRTTQTLPNSLPPASCASSRAASGC